MLRQELGGIPLMFCDALQFKRHRLNGIFNPLEGRRGIDRRRARSQSCHFRARSEPSLCEAPGRDPEHNCCEHPKRFVHCSTASL